MLTYRQRNEALLADVVNEEADGSLAFPLGTWSSLTNRRLVYDDYVGELDGEALLTWATVVDFSPLFGSSCFHPGAWLVCSILVSVKRTLWRQFVNDIACRAR